jgi:hypothetical protein
MDRITMKRLQSIVALINSTLDMPPKPYADKRDDRGGLVANAGNYHLDCAYGGYKLVRMCPGGGERDISPRGTKRETYDYCRAFLDGIGAARESGQ